MKRRYDVGRRPFKGEPGDLVLLSIKSHPDFGEARKLRLRYTGPYVIAKKVHDNAYQLDGLPPSVPPTQNVEYLRLYYPSPERFKTRPNLPKAPGPIQYRDHHEWEVESITGDQMVNGQRRYWIKWRDHEKQSLLRLAQLRHCAELLREYQKTKGLALDFWTDTSSSPESQGSGSEDNDSSDEESSSGAPATSPTPEPSPATTQTPPEPPSTTPEPSQADPNLADDEGESDTAPSRTTSRPQTRSQTRQQKDTRVAVTRQDTNNAPSFDWNKDD